MLRELALRLQKALPPPLHAAFIVFTHWVAGVRKTPPFRLFAIVGTFPLTSAAAQSGFSPISTLRFSLGVRLGEASLFNLFQTQS